jgi:hypothetical protein
VSDLVNSLIGVVVGALATGGVTYTFYRKRRADSRRDEQRRAKESGLQAQQQVARELFKCAYSAKTWLSGLPSWVNAPDTPAQRDEIREEAMRRRNECHDVWDFSHTKVDSAEVQSAMGRLDLELQAVLETVVQGDVSPDLSAFTQSLKALQDVANRRLDARI